VVPEIKVCLENADWMQHRKFTHRGSSRGISSSGNTRQQQRLQVALCLQATPGLSAGGGGGGKCHCSNQPATL